MKNYLILITFLLCINSTLIAQQANQKKKVPASVYTTKTVSVYSYNESKGQMIYLTEAELRKEKRYTAERAWLPDGHENGYSYFIFYELLSYKNNQVWISLHRSASKSNIKGYSHKIFVNDQIGFIYFNEF